MSDPQRSYPNHLAERVRATWPADGLPLPASFELILDAAYHASFLRDEERPVACRILVISPAELPIDAGPPAGLLPLAFTTPRAFDEYELLRLSPAADAQRALVGVAERDGKLCIWGIVQSGPRWLQVAHGGRSQEPPLPPCLVVRILRPGHLVVGCGSRLVAELHGGQLSDVTLDVFQSQWLATTFGQARRATVSDHAAATRTALDAPVASELARYISQQMIKRVIATIRAAHHGGLLVIVPPECLADQFLFTNYALHEGQARKHFKRLVLAILETLAERATATGRAPDPDLYRSDLDPRIAELDEALFEMSHLIASLANVDGAVVLTKRFELLGFGAEIAGSLPQVTEVRRGLDLEADTFTTDVVDLVGTRHRSAYRFCGAVPNTVAIVVSQDGGVRFVARHRDHVTYWLHGPSDA